MKDSTHHLILLKEMLYNPIGTELSIKNSMILFNGFELPIRTFYLYPTWFKEVSLKQFKLDFKKKTLNYFELKYNDKPKKEVKKIINKFFKQ